MRKRLKYDHRSLHNEGTNNSLISEVVVASATANTRIDYEALYDVKKHMTIVSKTCLIFELGIYSNTTYYLLNLFTDEEVRADQYKDD